MTVFITGGAGFLGINLVRYLLLRGWHITSFDIAPFDYPERERVRAITGDIRDLPALSSAMRGSDVVVHCAAALPSYTADAIMSTEVAGTRHVLQAALEHDITRVVHISSTAVYGTKASGATETSPIEVIGPYAEAKILAEKECEPFRARGMCVPILRPKTFVGPERLGIWSILYDWAHSGSGFPLIGQGHKQYQWLGVEGLSDATRVAVTTNANQVDDVFHGGPKQFGTLR